MTCDRAALAQATYVVEAIVEEHAAKTALFAELAEILGPDAILATTTSSLSAAELGAESGRPERFAALHVFNPVTKMALVELAFPAAASDGHQAPARTRCAPRSARPRSTSPTRPASSSTGCSSPTCSTPSSCSSARAWSRRRSTRA